MRLGGVVSSYPNGRLHSEAGTLPDAHHWINAGDWVPGDLVILPKNISSEPHFFVALVSTEPHIDRVMHTFITDGVEAVTDTNIHRAAESLAERLAAKYFPRRGYLRALMPVMGRPGTYEAVLQGKTKEKTVIFTVTCQ